ncbi:MAG TPA: HAMP domain-containing sensor histidine kinase [Actinoplanes sp.]|jgi:signal transduction histidine kinase|nr:HAMP domain-containing sensor histidine kinase [Actinoplanes sp.]
MSRPRLPRFAQSIRFRLTVLYSTLLFALAAAGLAVTYVAVERTTDPKPITKQYEGQLIRNGVQVGTVDVARVDEIESAVNFRTLQTLRTYSFVALGGLFLASLGIGWVLSGRALRPVAEIARTAREIQATDLSRRIRLDGTKDELRDLADTIDSMLDRLADAFRAQRQLIDDASHELRSPLAIIRTNLDASLSGPEVTDAERTRAVAIIDRATTRMSRLVEDLLATARRDTDALADTDVDLAAVAGEVGEDFADLAAESGVHLRSGVRGADLVVIGDHDALRRAAGNLLSNAIRLSPPGATVAVATGRTDGWLWLAVADKGPGIAVADQARVFDRFWRGEPQRGSRDRRTGLGLAIVRQIIEAHGGHAAVFSTLGAGSTFVLWLPTPDRSDESAPPKASPLE